MTAGGEGKIRTSFLDARVVGLHHGGRDDGVEFAVGVLLLRVDAVADRVRDVFEHFLVHAQLLLEHVQAGDVGAVVPGTRLDVAVEVFD